MVVERLSGVVLVHSVRGDGSTQSGISFLRGRNEEEKWVADDAYWEIICNLPPVRNGFYRY